MNKSSIIAIILAAGLSRRMGKPKMLLPWGSTSIIGQVLTTYQLAGVDELLVITGGVRTLIENEVSALAIKIPVNTIFNPQFENGEMLLSLQCGLKAVTADFNYALVGLGDQPQISREAIVKIISGTNSLKNKLIIPSYDMHRGHPWLIRRDLWPSLLSLISPLTIHDFLKQHNRDTHYIETDHTVLKDIDTRDDYEREKP